MSPTRAPAPHPHDSKVAPASYLFDEASRAELRSIFMLYPDPVLVLDPEGRIGVTNPAGTLLLGEGSASFRYWPFSSFLEPSRRSEFAQSLVAALGGTAQQLSSALQSSPGRPIELDLILVPFERDGAVAGVYVVAKDITEQKAAEARLEETDAHLRHSAKMEAVGRLAGGIAHDFNNLLTAIRGYTDLLLRATPDLGAARGDLAEIDRAVERAASLTRQLLAFSRQHVVQTKRIDANAVVEDIRGLLTRLIRAETKLLVSSSTEQAWIDADPVHLHQVIINLAVNAQDAMPEGGRLTVEVGHCQIGLGFPDPLVPLPAGPYVTLTVSDTGCGMTSEVQSHLFEPFFTTKPPGHGTGLGLSTAYGIIEQCGGRIGFLSSPEIGTDFVIYLPERSAPVGAGPSQDDARRLPTGTETVLLVEDEATIRAMIRKILGNAGYTVLEARHGADALLLSRDYPGTIDLLLTDVVMPELNGLRLAEAIGTERPGTRILFMSGYTRDEVDRKGLTEPGVAFLPKPFTVSELATMVREVLDLGV